MGGACEGLAGERSEAQAWRSGILAPQRRAELTDSGSGESLSAGKRSDRKADRDSPEWRKSAERLPAAADVPRRAAWRKAAAFYGDGKPDGPRSWLKGCRGPSAGSAIGRRGDPVTGDAKRLAPPAARGL